MADPKLLRRLTCVTVGLLVAVFGGARADSVIPGPGQPGFDEELARKADAFDVQVHALMTPPLGWGLEALVVDPASRAIIDDFFASGARDFEAHTGLHPYEVLSSYGEMGDLGMFGGVQAAGDAFRYAVLRDTGAPAEEVDRARTALLRAMDGLHWYTAVTGVPGVVARGLQRANDTYSDVLGGGATLGSPRRPLEVPDGVRGATLPSGLPWRRSEAEPGTTGLSRAG